MITFILYSFIINLIFYIFFNKISNLLNIFDTPDSNRKLHKNKVACLGGILFFINLILFLFYLILFPESLKSYDKTFLGGNRQYYSFFFVSFVIFVIGLFDDKVNLSASYKSILLILILITSLADSSLSFKILRFEFLNYNISLGFFEGFFSVLAIFYFMNALNMFDGINIQTPLYIILTSCFLIFKDQTIFIFTFIPGIFFLILNIRGKCFLGNSGSYFLGFLISLILIKINQTSPLLLTTEEILILLSVPCLELFRLFIERISKNQSPFFGDREHIHHYLSKKFTDLETSLLTNGFIFIPLVISQFIEFKIIIFILQVIFYFITIYKLKKF
jgi:UDP-GlcNAc:undecaprenyl-phosphate GlcNAc-1-phosphate transferase